LIKKLVITGINGQDGKILAKKLNKEKKFKIFGFDKKKSLNDSSKKIKILNFLNNKKKLNFFFKKNRIDIIIHLAANNPCFKQKSREIYFKKNVINTKNLFEAVYKNNLKSKFIFCSSSQIFRDSKGLINEKSTLLSKSDYTRFRIQADKEMLKFKNNYKIKYTNIIFFNHDSKFRNKKFILPRVIKAIINKNIKFLNSIIKENIYKDFSHAEDICDGILKIAKSSKNLNKVILSSGRLTSLNSIIKYVMNKNNIKLNLNFNKTRPKNKTIYGDNNVAKSEFNWTPKKNIYIAANDLYKHYVLNSKILK
jgi:nucleoside-diphosphate-sugar epimerase